MFSLCSNCLALRGRRTRRALPPSYSFAKSSPMTEQTPPKKPKGGRPKGDPAAVRVATIGVRVSPDEFAALRTKAEHMSMTPAQWLREAALTRRLPSPPVPAINREQYAELARLAANLNQLSRKANEGQAVTLSDALLKLMIEETKRLRLALLGIGDAE